MKTTFDTLANLLCLSVAVVCIVCLLVGIYLENKMEHTFICTSTNSASTELTLLNDKVQECFHKKEFCKIELTKKYDGTLLIDIISR